METCIKPRRRAGAAAIALVAALALPASAQDTSPGSVPSAYRAEYLAVLRNPQDIDRAFALARRIEVEAASGKGNTQRLYRLASRIYERILFQNADVTQVLLRLGEVHYRLGNYAESRGYFSRAAERQMPPDMQIRTDRYLEELDKRLAPNDIFGSLVVALRHQSNATAGPADELLEFPDLVVEGSDQDIYAALLFVHRFDPFLQSGLVLETRIDGYASKHFDNGDLDTIELDLTFGPRFDLSSYGQIDWTIRPHVVLRDLAVDGRQFAFDAGVGLDAEAIIDRRLRFSLDLRAVEESHNATDDRPNLDERDGGEYSGRLGASYQLREQLTVGGAVLASWSEAEVQAEEERRRGVELWGRMSYTVGEGSAGDWVSTLSLGWTDAEFGEDLAGDVREDDYFWTRFSTEVPVSRSLSVVGAVGYNQRDSNKPQFDYENWEVSLGVAYRF